MNSEKQNVLVAVLQSLTNKLLGYTHWRRFQRGRETAPPRSDNHGGEMYLAPRICWMVYTLRKQVKQSEVIAEII